MNHELRGFCDALFEQYHRANIETVTDEIFLLIQNNHDLMHQYLRLVQNLTLDVVNRTIGAEIKSQFNLINAPRRQWKPRSTLIQSHQIFESRAGQQ